MVSAVGSTTPGLIPGATNSSTSLQATIDSCRRQLADWVTCPSAKTPEGKAKIEQISSRMAAAEAQLKSAPGSSAAQAPPAASANDQTRLVDVYA